MKLVCVRYLAAVTPMLLSELFSFIAFDSVLKLERLRQFNSASFIYALHMCVSICYMLGLTAVFSLMNCHFRLVKSDLELW